MTVEDRAPAAPALAHPAHTEVDAAVFTVLQGQPGITGFSVTERPTGELVFITVEDEDAEDRAYQRLASAYALLQDQPVEFVCVEPGVLDRLMLSPGARQYDLPR